ncbi:type II secretion system protein [Planctomycetes bacterium TBK1r]
MNNQRSETHRSGFTLVELLVVITIIAAIAGLTIPAVGVVMKTVRMKAMRAEMSNIEGGIDSYYTKYGDYPPDFSNWNIVKRHYLKIFPDIAQSELDLLYRLCDVRIDNDNTSNPPQMTPNPQSIAWDPTAMDRSEVLVWSLGGFSADPQYPFTGPGGPLVTIPNTANPAPDDPQYYEYNPTRNAPEVNFAPDRLSIVNYNASLGARSFTNRNMSNDESIYSTGNADVFPSYVLRDGGAPTVYFDARTYNSFVTTGSGDQFNGYARLVEGEWDSIRPVYSTTSNNPPTNPPYGSRFAASQGWQFMNPQTYQVLSPGLDGLYSDVADSDGEDPTNANPAYFQVNGGMIVLDPTANTPTGPLGSGGLQVSAVQKFDVTGLPTPSLKASQNPFRDNLANFLDQGTFYDALD